MKISRKRKNREEEEWGDWDGWGRRGHRWRRPGAEVDETASVAGVEAAAAVVVKCACSSLVIVKTWSNLLFRVAPFYAFSKSQKCHAKMIMFQC